MAMAAYISHSRIALILGVILLLHRDDHCRAALQESDRKVYIVYMGEFAAQENSPKLAVEIHHDMLHSVLGSHDAAEESLIYSYGKSFNGFAAMLSTSEAEEISNMDGVISIFESQINHLHTTRSWDFIGFPQSAKRNLQYERDVIVGMLDSGIWPESNSFNDSGFGPPPAKWKGKCQTASDFPTCNNKIIGARFYSGSFRSDVPPGETLSPRDNNGHGTHTASTAAGNVVRNASLLGLAQGDARGGVPGARVAVYKVCWNGRCADADVLAAFDDAIHDGVDIISISIGRDSITDYFQDSIAIGSFHAMRRGILTSNSAGNSGPLRATVVNCSPWSLTVAATYIDRQFYTPVVLGNKMDLREPGINTFSPEKAWYPLIYGRDAANTSAGYTSEEASQCAVDSLDHNKVKGKIVICAFVYGDTSPDEVVFLAGGAGMALMTNSYYDYEITRPFMIPVGIISPQQEQKLRSYANSTRSPVASILKSIGDNHTAAPTVASFSARGPNLLSTGILKPDIGAPGYEILAAWSRASSLSGLSEDKRFVDFNLLSGTSMACPHASGAAAYVKSFHPEWSPAAIKSALMTTARPMDTDYSANKDAELAFGSGQIDPLKAIDPGLVYDTDENSYIDMLCSEGYDTAKLRLVTGDNNTSCSKHQQTANNGDSALNYPSMMILSPKDHLISTTFVRTVTNVGPAQSTYRAAVNAPFGTLITVEPSILSFTSANQKLSFSVRVEGQAKAIYNPDTLLSGSLTWTSGNYSVRSPLCVYVPDIPPPAENSASALAPAPAPVTSLHRKNAILRG